MVVVEVEDKKVSGKRVQAPKGRKGRHAGTGWHSLAGSQNPGTLVQEGKGPFR